MFEERLAPSKIIGKVYQMFGYFVAESIFLWGKWSVAIMTWHRGAKHSKFFKYRPLVASEQTNCKNGERIGVEHQNKWFSEHNITWKQFAWISCAFSEMSKALTFSPQEMFIWNMNLQMHDKLYGGFVGHTKQDQKLGMNYTLTYKETS